MAFYFKYKGADLIVLVIAIPALLTQHRFAQQATGEKFSMTWNVMPFYKYRTDGKAGRVIDFFIKGFSGKVPVSIKLTCDSLTETTTFNSLDNFNRVSLILPEGIGVTNAATVTVLVSIGSQQMPATIAVSLKKQWTVYIYPHSHLDIGYTALPEDVQKLHVRNIEVGIDLAKKTATYPKGARFVWNPEATWVVMNYLKGSSTGQKLKFAEAVKKGWVQIDGGHSNCNTSTFSDEEAYQFFGNVPLIKKETGVPVTTMVQMDVPGVGWGMVQTAAQFGIKGIINFPNYFDLRRQWEHKPFYWLAPDSKTKVLFLQGYPYGIGYTIKGSKYGLEKLQTFSSEYDRVSTSNPMENFLDPFIFEETEKLERNQSPYDLFAMTWSMADNCVIDADLPEAVKQWNQTYAYPKLVISGAKEILDAYEKKYASIIPTYKGDFTEFWTNGLGSDAASVGAGRRAKEDLVQAEILSVILASNQPVQLFNEAWENSLLSAEHTWGAQDSKSLLAQQVEKIKSGYFTNAAREAIDLIKATLAPFTDTTTSSFSVINTLSWQRSGIVTLSNEQSGFGDSVMDDHNKVVLSQRLSTGELIFEATDVPALGSKLYKLVKEKVEWKSDLSVSTTGLRNDLIALQVNSSGVITSVKGIDSSYEYVDSSVGINKYEYVAGVYNGNDASKAPTTDRPISIRIKEAGPLLASLLITSKGDGVKNLQREIRLYSHQPSVEITNTLDKISTLNKEGIHFSFGFNLPKSIGHIDMPWSIVRPNEDQLQGANKNWLAFQRWIDISNQDHGITWTAIQSPLVEWGSLSGNILDGARQYWSWQRTIPQASLIYSWPVNNHWDTNFPLEQGGSIQQQYAFTIHDGYDVVKAARFGMEAHRPLIVVQSKKNVIKNPWVQIDNPRLMLSALKTIINKKEFLLRIRSISDKTEKLLLRWPAGQPRKIIECTVDGESTKTMKDSIEIAPFGSANLKVIF